MVQCVATLLDAWPDSPGITGRDRVESAAGIKWNHRPGSRGMPGRDRLEFAAARLDAAHLIALVVAAAQGQVAQAGASHRAEGEILGE